VEAQGKEEWLEVLAARALRMRRMTSRSPLCCGNVQSSGERHGVETPSLTGLDTKTLNCDRVWIFMSVPSLGHGDLRR